MPSPNIPLTSEQLQQLLNGPAGVPPPGVVPNFDNASNLNNYVILTMTLCVTFSTMAVFMRAYTKLFIIRSLAYEDYAVLIAWIAQIAEAVPALLTKRYGGGIHIWNVRLKDLFNYLYWINITSIPYCLVLFFIKLAILLQYLRIFCPTRKRNMFVFVGAYICIGSIFLYYFVAIMFQIFLCTPREKIWNLLLEGGHCFNSDALFQATGIFNVISDFAIFLLPMRAVWKLQISIAKKLGVTAIFATGLFGSVISIVRTYYTWIAVHSSDITYNTSVFGLWTFAEIAIGIIISCLPISPRFFQFVGPKIRATLSFRSQPASHQDSVSNSNSAGYKIFLSTNWNRLVRKSDGDSSAPRSWIEPFDPGAHPNDGYITLDLQHQAQDTTQSRSEQSLDPTDALHRTRQATKDIHHGIEVVHTTCIESSPRDDGMIASVEVKCRSQGW